MPQMFRCYDDGSTFVAPSQAPGLIIPSGLIRVTSAIPGNNPRILLSASGADIYQFLHSIHGVTENAGACSLGYFILPDGDTPVNGDMFHGLLLAWQTVLSMNRHSLQDFGGAPLACPNNYNLWIGTGSAGNPALLDDTVVCTPAITAYYSTRTEKSFEPPPTG